MGRGEIDEPWLLLIPGLTGIGGRPDFSCRGDDSAMLRVGELQAEDIAAQLNPTPRGLNSDPMIAGIRGMK